MAEEVGVLLPQKSGVEAAAGQQVDAPGVRRFL